MRSYLGPNQIFGSNVSSMTFIETTKISEIFQKNKIKSKRKCNPLHHVYTVCGTAQFDALIQLSLNSKNFLNAVRENVQVWPTYVE